MKLGFIGGGNMAAALIGGLLERGGSATDITVAEPLAERRAWLAQTWGVAVEASAAGAAQADVVVLAVKPQVLQAVVRALPPLHPHQLLLSIAAGVRAADIARWLGGHAAVARAMPNTPALVGEGVTGLYALPGVSAAQREQATQVMQAVGTALWVAEEGQIDAVTAISGSGPAYVFLFIEALEAAARELGLAADTARSLSLQTFYGAAALAVRDSAPPAELRARVTSKGGTTERGILALEQGGVRTVVAQAARAAADRAHEMGELFGKDA
ncbi:MAG: pyrroline-5-carboxylate reductase [Betaproteobacteria bacterium]|nr:pyrroline-5-carboxylate reductase [Betaproteobacteria bacterium]